MADAPDRDFVTRLDAALRAGGPAGGPVCVVHHIGDELTYHITIDATGSRAGLGLPEADCDVVEFRQSTATAAAIRAGELAAAEALLLGRVTVRGDLSRLVAHRDLLAAIDTVAAGVR